MNLTRTFATTGRVLRQMRHDRRTLALVFLMPSVLMTILYFIFDGNRLLFDAAAPLLLGIIPFTLMFIVASVAVLRERTSGTLERLLTSPATKADIVGGYATAFAILAAIQASVTTLVTLNLMTVNAAGPAAEFLVVAVLSGVAGMAFGLLFSAFARNEFQAVQFMPAFVLPQFLTCGLFIPRDSMATLLRYFSDVMPITYVVKALQQALDFSGWTTSLTIDVMIILGFIGLALGLGAVSLRSK